MARNEFNFAIEVDQFSTWCDKITARGARLRPLMFEIAFELERTTKERFDDEAGPDGVPWVDLRPSTLARKRAKTKLRERGNLFRTIASDAGDDFAEVTEGMEYAAIHQFGGTPDMAPGPAAVPARPSLGVSVADTRFVLDAARRYLVEVGG